MSGWTIICLIIFLVMMCLMIYLLFNIRNIGMYRPRSKEQKNYYDDKEK